MSIFSTEFSPQALVPSTTHEHAHARFAPLSFGKRQMTELCEGYYRIDLQDGTTRTVEAASALDALRMAQNLGEVRKVQREIFNRRRMVRDLSATESESVTVSGALKPGTVLLSFESLCRWQEARDALHASSSDAAPSSVVQALLPAAEEPILVDLAGETEMLPATAGEVAAGILDVLRQGGPEGEA